MTEAITVQLQQQLYGNIKHPVHFVYFPGPDVYKNWFQVPAQWHVLNETWGVSLIIHPRAMGAIKFMTFIKWDDAIRYVLKKYWECQIRN